VSAPTILVIDDSPSMRGLLRLTFERAGYRVQEAQDGQEAIDRLLECSPAAIVCDLTMPGMDGLGFLRYLRHHPTYRRVPLMLLSTESRPEVRQKAREQGAQAFMNKPCRPGDLLAAVQRLLQTPT
jgi:two-component system chemotaxis response regulator CheY